MNTFRKIDMDTWPRAAHCRAFRDSLLPSYCVTVELDITHFQPAIAPTISKRSATAFWMVT